jgi:hypothetical protein
MLFDLRGRGRRRAVQVIYVTLALLLGGGLVLFGIGGNTSGGLFDAFREDSGDGDNAIANEAKDARKAAAARPTDAAVFARLADAEYRLAGQTDGFSAEKAAAEQPAFSGKALVRLQAAGAAWDKHVQLAGDKPNSDTAAIARLIFATSGLNKPDKVVQAQEIIIDANPNPGFGDYAQLAVAAWGAGQNRKGDLASEKAVELSAKSQRKQVKASLDAEKARITQAAAQAATGGAAAAPTATSP